MTDELTQRMKMVMRLARRALSPSSRMRAEMKDEVLRQLRPSGTMLSSIRVSEREPIRLVASVSLVDKHPPQASRTTRRAEGRPGGDRTQARVTAAVHPAPASEDERPSGAKKKGAGRRRR